MRLNSDSYSAVALQAVSDLQAVPEGADSYELYRAVDSPLREAIRPAIRRARAYLEFPDKLLPSGCSVEENEALLKRLQTVASDLSGAEHMILRMDDFPGDVRYFRECKARCEEVLDEWAAVSAILENEQAPEELIEEAVEN